MQMVPSKITHVIIHVKKRTIYALTSHLHLPMMMKSASALKSTNLSSVPMDSSMITHASQGAKAKRDAWLIWKLS